MLKGLAAFLLTVAWMNAFAAERDAISYESLIPAGSPCDTTSRERDRISQPVERIANFVMVVSNKGHCEHHMDFKEVDAIAKKLIFECEWVKNDPAFACHVVMVNEKWVASASDFRHLTSARIRWNKRTHIVKKVKTMPLNERARLLVNAEIDHNLAFGNFDFQAPLSKQEIPTHGVVGLTQYGRRQAPLLHNPWQTRVRKQIVQELSTAPDAIFLAPVRTIGYGLNAAHRKAISLKFARQIGRVTGQQVHDPLQIQRAFGPGVRSVPLAQLMQLAAQVGARTVIIPEVGHDNANDLVFRTHIAIAGNKTGDLVAPPGLAGRQRFTPTENLVLSIDGYAKRVGTTINRLDAFAKVSRLQRLKPDSSRVVSVPAVDALMRNEASLLNTAAQYQWLGALVSESDPELRGELYARSVAHLSESPTREKPLERLLMARGLAEMGALPAARLILHTDDKNTAFGAYRSFSLGQVQSMHAALKNLPPSFIKDLLLTDYIRLLRSTGNDKLAWQLTDTLIQKYPSWQRFLHQSGTLQGLVNDTALTPDNCQKGIQFCPNRAAKLVSDALTVNTAVQSVFTQINSGAQLLESIKQLDSVLIGHPKFERAVLTSSTHLPNRPSELAQYSQLVERLAAAQNYLRTGLEFSDAEILQPGKTYDVVMFPAYKYRRASDQDYPPVFSNGRAFQYSRYSQGAGLTDYFFFRLPGKNLIPSSARVSAARKAR